MILSLVLHCVLFSFSCQKESVAVCNTKNIKALVLQLENISTRLNASPITTPRMYSSLSLKSYSNLYVKHRIRTFGYFIMVWIVVINYHTML